jgi:hypothetical protein
MNVLIIVPVVILIIYMIFKYGKVPEEEKLPPPPIDPSAPGVHYYEECDYMGEHKHTEEVTTVTDDFKSIRIVDDFDVRAYNVDDVEVFIRGPSTIKCTPFKSMEITRD